MEITKRGTIPRDRTWVGHCSNCGSEATATEAEMTHIVSSQREGRSSWETCPVCGLGIGGHGGMLFSQEVVDRREF